MSDESGLLYPAFRKRLKEIAEKMGISEQKALHEALELYKKKAIADAMRRRKLRVIKGGSNE